MAAASSSSYPDAWDESWWQDDGWSYEDEDAYGAQHHVRCSDCGRHGHTNSGSSKCPRHRAPSKGGGKRDSSPRRFGKGGGKGGGKYRRGPRPNRFAQRSLGFFGFLMGAFGQCCPWMTRCPGVESLSARQCPDGAEGNAPEHCVESSPHVPPHFLDEERCTPMKFTAHDYQGMLASMDPSVDVTKHFDRSVALTSMQHAWALPVAEVSLDALWAQPGDQRGFGISDIGCTKDVASTNWFKETQNRMKQFGLRPVCVKDDTLFRGLGGSSRRAKQSWKLPVGVFGTHDVMCVAEIDGDMPMLISVWQLASWGAQMDIRRNVHSFEALGVHNVAMPRSDGGHFLVDVCAYGEDPASDPLFAEFVM